MTNKFQKIKKEILDIMLSSPLVFELEHAKRTLKWVLKLKPDADESLQIAALAHDIDRPITKITETYNLKNFNNIDEFKRQHAIRSAKIIKGLMKKYSYKPEIIKKTKKLVRYHEIGGNKEINCLKEADSIAYFDYNVDFYYQKNGENKTKDKIKWMYKRLSSKSKKLVNKIEYKKPINRLFKLALKELNEE